MELGAEGGIATVREALGLGAEHDAWLASRVRFVFHRTAVSLDQVPRQTTLERAIVAHLRAGGHWHERTGWVEL